ncbi:MAG: metalloregulator ArsR/SmtB family transcription factor [Chloroflexota bacterium]
MSPVRPATKDRPAPASPQVRDFAAPGAGFAIEWDVRPVYDFLFSLTDEAGRTEDLPEADRTWLRETKAAMPANVRAEFDGGIFAAELGIFLAGFAVDRPEVQTAAAFVDALDAVSTDDLLRAILRDVERDPELGDLVQRAIAGDSEALDALRDHMPDHKAGIHALLSDPPDAHRRIVRVLRAWATPFTAIEPRIRKILERDHALRAADRGAYAGSELIERTTGGVRWLGEVGIRRVILAPSYFSRPFNFLLAGDDWRFFGYPVADEALEVVDRLSPPAALIRLHRALGDETRLRILKLLAGKDLYLTEIAQQLDLSKPTIKHHLALLRAAGLVTVTESGAVIYYTLRRERLEAASADLAGFLVP